MLNPRETQILRAVIQEYSGSAHPVGSRVLWSRYGFGISPATIRGVMNALTEAGYLAQPHTSAGRVPTDRAYRLFLENTVASTPSASEQEKLSRRVAKISDAGEAISEVASQLSEVGGAVGFSVIGRQVSVFNLGNAFGQPEFQDPRVAHYLAQLLDQLAEWVPKMTGPDGVTVRIGEENDDFRARQISLITAQAGDAYFGIIGSTRMPYRKLMSLFTYAKKLLEEKHG